MIRTVLFLLTSCIVAYGQDTLATVFPKGRVLDSEVAFVGDSVLVRFMYLRTKKFTEFSEAAWYNSKGKIANADVSALGENNILGVKKIGDSVYYYTRHPGLAIETFGSAGLGTPATVSMNPIRGMLVRGVSKGDHFLVLTWDRKSTTVTFYDFFKSKLVDTHSIKLWPDADDLKDEDIIFIAADDPARISASAVLLKLFLYDDTFCAVFDAPQGSGIKQNRTYKTRVFRKNLITGAEDNDVFMTLENFTFKSYLQGLNGNTLYRFSSLRDGCELTVHNLDNNRMVDQQPIGINKGDSAITRLGGKYHIARSELKRLNARSLNKKWDIGITVDDYQDKKIVAIGGVDFTAPDEAEMTGIIPIPIPGFGLIVIITARMIKNDPNNITYTYYEGTPASGFKVVPSNGARDFIKIKVDNFELRNMTDRTLDYVAYYGTNKYWISLHSFVDSPRYFITKFPLQP